MSQENVEVVKRLYQTFRRPDERERAFELLHPEFVFDASRFSVPDLQAVYHGHDGVRTFWRGWLAAWEWVEFEYTRYIDARDKVIVEVQFHARGRSSGVEVETTSYAQVWTLDAGLATRMDYYPTLTEALEAVGLSE